MSADPPIVLVVEDAFVIRGRGVIISPALDPNRLRSGTRLTIELVEPNGRVRQVTRQFSIEFRLLDGGSRQDGVILLDESGDQSQREQNSRRA